MSQITYKGLIKIENEVEDKCDDITNDNTIGIFKSEQITDLGTKVFGNYSIKINKVRIYDVFDDEYHDSYHHYVNEVGKEARHNYFVSKLILDTIDDIYKAFVLIDSDYKYNIKTKLISPSFLEEIKSLKVIQDTYHDMNNKLSLRDTSSRTRRHKI